MMTAKELLDYYGYDFKGYIYTSVKVLNAQCSSAAVILLVQRCLPDTGKASYVYGMGSKNVGVYDAESRVFGGIFKAGGFVDHLTGVDESVCCWPLGDILFDNEI